MVLDLAGNKLTLPRPCCMPIGTYFVIKDAQLTNSLYMFKLAEDHNGKLYWRKIRPHHHSGFGSTGD